MENKNRIKTLDSFRGIAVLSVILFHYTTRYNEIFNTSYSWTFPYGSLGVPVFFILSGFVIHLTVDRCKNATEFLTRRFLRLYPTYWLSLILTLCFVGFFRLYEREEFRLNILDIVMNFTMWQEFFGFKNVDGAYWSLLPELLFYLLMAFLIWKKLLNHFYAINILLLLLGIFHLFISINIINKVLDLQYILLFFIGVCFYRLKNKKNLIFEHFFIFLNLFVGAFLYHKAQSSFNVNLLLGAFTLIVFVYYFFYWGKLNWLGKCKILIFLGNISYGLYLIHQVMGYAIINYFEEKFYSRTLGMLIAFLASISIAYIITYKIEPAFRKKLRDIKIFSLTLLNK